MIRHLKSIFGSTAIAAILASAAMTAAPTAAGADWRHDDHRDDHRDVRHDDHRDDRHDRDDHGVIIVDRPAPIVVAAPPPNRVWVEPVYRNVSEQVYVAPTYRPVTQRVWVPDQFKTIPNPFGGPSQRVLVKAAHYEDVCRQELVCDGHYETQTRQELVSAGHWVDGCTVVESVPQHDSGFHLNIHF